MRINIAHTHTRISANIHRVLRKHCNQNKVHVKHINTCFSQEMMFYYIIVLMCMFVARRYNDTCTGVNLIQKSAVDGENYIFTVRKSNTKITFSYEIINSNLTFYIGLKKKHQLKHKYYIFIIKIVVHVGRAENNM